MTRFVVVAAVACAFGAPGAFAFPHVSADLRSGKTVIRKVLILPPHVGFEKLGVKGAEGMTEQAGQIGAGLYGVLAAVLKERGVEAIPLPVTNATDEIRYAEADLQTKYDSVRKQIWRRPNQVDKGGVTLGDGISRFSPARGVDAIVLVRAAGLKATTAKTAALLIGFGAASNFVCEITFVDAHSGDVLAWLRYTHVGDLSVNTEWRLDSAINKILRDVPLGVAPQHK